MNPQRAGPRFIGATAAFVVFEKREIGHRIGGNKLVFSRGKLRLLVDASPGSGVEISLMQHKAVGVTRVERHHFSMVGVAIDDMFCAPIAEVLLGQRVLAI